jgi:hypothetical protein
MLFSMTMPKNGVIITNFTVNFCNPYGHLGKKSNNVIHDSIFCEEILCQGAIVQVSYFFS